MLIIIIIIKACTDVQSQLWWACKTEHNTYYACLCAYEVYRYVQWNSQVLDSGCIVMG